jgi:predicted RNA-binding protein
MMQEKQSSRIIKSSESGSQHPEVVKVKNWLLEKYQIEL